MDLTDRVQAMKTREPPVTFLVQADLYEEERDGDWAELHQLNLDGGSSTFEVTAAALGQLVTSRDEEESLLAELLQRCLMSLERDIEE